MAFDSADALGRRQPVYGMRELGPPMVSSSLMQEPAYVTGSPFVDEGAVSRDSFDAGRDRVDNVQRNMSVRSEGDDDLAYIVADGSATGVERENSIVAEAEEEQENGPAWVTLAAANRVPEQVVNKRFSPLGNTFLNVETNDDAAEDEAYRRHTFGEFTSHRPSGSFSTEEPGVEFLRALGSFHEEPLEPESSRDQCNDSVDLKPLTSGEHDVLSGSCERELFSDGLSGSVQRFARGADTSSRSSEVLARWRQDKSSRPFNPLLQRVGEGDVKRAVPGPKQGASFSSIAESISEGPEFKTFDRFEDRISDRLVPGRDQGLLGGGCGVSPSLDDGRISNTIRPVEVFNRTFSSFDEGVEREPARISFRDTFDEKDDDAIMQLDRISCRELGDQDLEYERHSWGRNGARHRAKYLFTDGGDDVERTNSLDVSRHMGPSQGGSHAGHGASSAQRVVGSGNLDLEMDLDVVPGERVLTELLSGRAMSLASSDNMMLQEMAPAPGMTTQNAHLRNSCQQQGSRPEQPQQQTQPGNRDVRTLLLPPARGGVQPQPGRYGDSSFDDQQQRAAQPLPQEPRGDSAYQWPRGPAQPQQRTRLRQEVADGGWDSLPQTAELQHGHRGPTAPQQLQSRRRIGCDELAPALGQPSRHTAADGRELSEDDAAQYLAAWIASLGPVAAQAAARAAATVLAQQGPSSTTGPQGPPPGTWTSQELQKEQQQQQSQSFPEHKQCWDQAPQAARQPSFNANRNMPVRPGLVHSAAASGGTSAASNSLPAAHSAQQPLGKSGQVARGPRADQHGSRWEDEDSHTRRLSIAAHLTNNATTTARPAPAKAGCQQDFGADAPSATGSAAAGGAGTSKGSQGSQKAKKSIPNSENPGQPQRASWEEAKTLMVRNIPVRYTQDMLLKEWPNDTGMYDFVYLPICIDRKRNASFCFINFVDTESALKFHTAWHKQRLQHFSTRKPLDISPADVQGRDENLLQIVRNKTFRIRNVHFQPAIFDGADRVSMEAFMDGLDARKCGQGLKEDGRAPKPDRDITSSATLVESEPCVPGADLSQFVGLHKVAGAEQLDCHADNGNIFWQPVN